MNLPSLNRLQRFLLAGTALLIVIVQLYQFDKEGVDGTGWVISFAVASLLLVWAIQPSSAASEVAPDIAKRRLPLRLIALILGVAGLVTMVVVTIRESQRTAASSAAFSAALREVVREDAALGPVPTISLDALLTEYRDNEIAAAAKYGCSGNISCGSVFETSAEVNDIGRDAIGVPYLRLATNTPLRSGMQPPIMRSIEARFPDQGFFPPDERPLYELRRGQRVSLRCSARYAADTLTLTNCVVVKK